METENIQFSSIFVKRRKASAINGIKKAFCYMSAIIGFIVGFCLLFTIVGIPVSILMWMGSIGLMATANDQYQVSCPHCKKKVIVGKNQEDFTCKRCKQPFVINWIEDK